MALGDIFRIEVVHQVGSSPVMNVLHAMEEGPESVEERQAQAVVEMTSTLYQQIAASLADSWRVVSIYAIRVAPTTGIPAIVVLGGAEAIIGSVEGPHVPPQVAALISLYSTYPGPQGRGRIYIPGWPEAEEHDGQMHDDAWTSLDASLSMLTDENGPYAPGVGTYRFCITSPGSLYTPRPVASYILRPNLATQRRRRAFPGFGTSPA